MNKGFALAWTGGCLLGAATIWGIIAAWLSANEVITVATELASYWLALFAIFGGASLFLKRKDTSLSLTNFLFRYLFVGVAIIVFFDGWAMSSRRFVAWKMRSIPQSAWPKMVSDLEQIGKKAGQTGITSVSSQTPLPSSFQPLGLPRDYSGGMGNVWKTSDYSGPVASVLFGYKGRSWGLCLGPESFASGYARKGNYIAVASNTIFFCGPRD